jgi:DNA-binding beta-propeller fold protein YncE
MRLLRLLCIPLLAAAPLPAAAAGIAFVMNSGAASISVIDMTTHKELSRIPALREPHHWALSPDGKSLVVGDSAGNALLLLDPDTGTLQRRIPVSDPYQLGFSPDGKLLVVNGLARNQVDVYDAATFRLVKRFPIRSMPSHLAFSPDSSRVFVTLQGNNRLAAFDLTTMRMLWEVPVGSTPAGVLWHDGKLLVADMGTDHLVEVDPANGHELRRIVPGKGAHNLYLSPDGREIWVNNRVAGTTEEIDAKTFAPIRTFQISGGPDDLGFAPDGKVWITRRFAESVAILDPATGALTILPAGRSPHGIFLNPRAPTPLPTKVAARG